MDVGTFKRRLIKWILVIAILAVGLYVAVTLHNNKNNQLKPDNAPMLMVPPSPTKAYEEEVLEPELTATPFVNCVTSTPEVWYITTVAPEVTEKIVEDVPANNGGNVNTTIQTTAPESTSTPKITVSPEITAVPEATATPVIPMDESMYYDELALNSVIAELDKMNVNNEIFDEYDFDRKYDFYDQVSLENINQLELFKVLRSFYIDVIAHSFEFTFLSQDSTPVGINSVLQTACCGSCGRLKCVHQRENDGQMEILLNNVAASNVEAVNEELLKFFYENTINFSYSERHFLCCSCTR